MKNRNFTITICICFFSIFFSHVLVGNEIQFNASEIQTNNNGDLIRGFNGVKINNNTGLTINANNFVYDKLKSKLTFNGNVEAIDKINNITVKTQNAVYFEKLNTLVSKGITNIELDSNHKIETSDVKYDRAAEEVSSEKKTIITDILNNKFEFNKFSLSTSKRILKAEDIKITDNEKNTYEFVKVRFNLVTNEILGKDLAINLNNKIFNSPKNEPRLKGNALFYKDNITIVDKGVFTTCKKSDKCPPWSLSAEKIKHDKLKKTIFYNNALLKIYDVPVLYFPKFFHPDPTVKRQSGFLVPSISQSSTLGNHLSTPYYKVLSDQADLTFTPRFYDNETSIYQGEYRVFNKNSNHVLDLSLKNDSSFIFDKKKNSTQSHFFSKSNFDLDFDYFDQSNIDLKIQKISNDEYLKKYKIKSSLIESEHNLHSKIAFDANRDDFEIYISAEAFENLSLSKSDRFEYIYPSFNLSKDLKGFENGDLVFLSSGFNKKYETNISEKIVINDLNYKSNNKINLLGLVSSYEILIKNFNAKSKRSTLYKNKTENSLESLFNYQIKYPLKKTSKQFLTTISPTISARFSPNKSKDRSGQDRLINYGNVFSLNRIGTNDTVEGGQSITLGNEFTLTDKSNRGNELLSFNIATVFRDDENEDLPTNSTLGKKNSDIFGEMKLQTNEFIDFEYNFSLDNNLHTLNYNQMKSTITINNFITSFDYLEKNNALGNESYIANQTKLNFGENSSIEFKTRKNKEKDLTEYYNLIYQYKNDCLVAGLEYKKDYYNDGSIKPEEQLFFSVTILPFGKVNSPDVNQ